MKVGDAFRWNRVGAWLDPRTAGLFMRERQPAEIVVSWKRRSREPTNNPTASASVACQTGSIPVQFHASRSIAFTRFPSILSLFLSHTRVETLARFSRGSFRRYAKISLSSRIFSKSFEFLILLLLRNTSRRTRYDQPACELSSESEFPSNVVLRYLDRAPVSFRD